ncbi:MAG: hypothetical protein ACKO34_04690 [Vampirovibrionales bacterium]
MSPSPHHTPENSAAFHPGLQESPSILSNTILWMDVFRSDLSKLILNIWRQGLMPVTRRLDTGWKSASLPLNQATQEIVRRFHRAEVTPMMESLLFPKSHSDQEARLFYPHLTPSELYQLQQLPRLLLLGDLQGALTDKNAGGRYDQLGQVSSELGFWKQKTPTQWIEERFKPDDAISHHLRWSLGFKNQLTFVKESLDLHNTFQPFLKQRVPFLTDLEQYSPKDLKAVLKSTQGALEHVEQTGFLNFMPHLHQALLHASRGDFKQGHNRIEQPLIQRLLSVGLTSDEEAISCYKHYFEHLWSFLEFHDRDEVFKEKFFEASDAELLKSSLWLSFKSSITNPSLQQPADFKQALACAIAELVGTLRHGSVALGDKTLKQPSVIRFDFDAKNQLGIHDNYLDLNINTAYLQRVSTHLVELQQLSSEFLNLSKQNNHHVFQTQSRERLLPALQDCYLRLSYSHRGGDSLNRASLHRLLELPNPSAVKKLLFFGFQQESIRSSILPKLMNSTLMPQLLTNMALAITLMGIAWNWADNTIIQKIQNDVVEKKGNVLGSGTVLLGACIPGGLATWGLLKSDLLKTATHNHPVSKLVIASGVGLGIEALLSIWGLNTLFKNKPTIEKPTQPKITGEISFHQGSNSTLFPNTQAPKTLSPLNTSVSSSLFRI